MGNREEVKTEKMIKGMFGRRLYVQGLLLITLCLIAATQISAQPVGKVLEFQNAVYGPARGVLFRNPVGITFDRIRQEIYVADRGNHSIAVFDLNGRFLFSFPCQGINPRSGKKVTTEPMSIAVDKDGNILFTDNVSRSIQVRNYKGETISTIDIIEMLGLGDTRTFPRHLFLAEDGLLYVTISGDNNEVVVLDQERKVKRRFSGTGDGFTSLSGIWVDGEGKIYVTEVINVPSVQVYDLDGTFLFGFGVKDLGDSNFSQPRGIVTSSNGDMWIVDAARQVVKRFDRNGKFIEMVGGFGVGVGAFRYPVGISGDGEDQIVVLEKVGSRYQYFKINEGGSNDL
jgi:DNA-binding beta-propeller fold protein YncE